MTKRSHLAKTLASIRQRPTWGRCGIDWCQCEAHGAPDTDGLYYHLSEVREVPGVGQFLMIARTREPGTSVPTNVEFIEADIPERDTGQSATDRLLCSLFARFPSVGPTTPLLPRQASAPTVERICPAWCTSEHGYGANVDHTATVATIAGRFTITLEQERSHLAPVFTLSTMRDDCDDVYADLGIDEAEALAGKLRAWVDTARATPVAATASVGRLS